jgi:tetratricopeptide (TPR) repeat protein
LGEKDEAIRQGEQALAFDSVAKDALTRSGLMSALANVYARVGELQRALDMLEQAAKLPGGPSYGNLVLSDVWDPLRKEPRFEKIVASLAPKDRLPAAK